MNGTLSEREPLILLAVIHQATGSDMSDQEKQLKCDGFLQSGSSTVEPARAAPRKYLY